MEQALGLIAATLTTASFLPQVVKIWKSRSCNDLSFGTFGMFFVGVGLWLVYGILRRDLPIIVSNAVTIILAGGVLAGMYRFRSAKPAR